MFDILFGWRKASKCKRLLRQVRRRLVLLKNKRYSIVRQIREDVGWLLKLGHEQIAFSRVEQIYKDERMIEVYELLDHFCEFIIINLSYIRRHKDCPNNISEAISSLVFASARFGDIPELRKIRKLFGARYGQSLVTTAVELLPGNLVNPQLRDSLSIKSVAEYIKVRLVNEIYRGYCLQVHSEPLALEYKSEWHYHLQSKAKDDGRNGLLNLKAHQELSPEVTGNEVLCITLPSSDMNLPSGTVLPFSQGVGLQEEELDISYPDEWKVLVLAALAYPSAESFHGRKENVVHIDDVEEVQSPMSEDINFLDQRLFIFRAPALPERQRIENVCSDDSFTKTEDASCKRLSKRNISRDPWSFKDLSFQNYYGTQPSRFKSSSQRRKQQKNEKTLAQDATLCKREIMTLSELSPSRQSYLYQEESQKTEEDTNEGEVYYSSGGSLSFRSISMPVEREGRSQHTLFLRNCSFPVQQPSRGSHIHPKLPDYDELQSTFLALKEAYLRNKNR